MNRESVETSGQSNSPEVLRESVIRAQILEQWIHSQVHQPDVTFLKCLLKPFERLILRAQSRIDRRNGVRRNVSLPLLAKFNEQPLGFTLVARYSIGMCQQRHHQRAS